MRIPEINNNSQLDYIYDLYYSLKSDLANKTLQPGIIENYYALLDAILLEINIYLNKR